MLHQIRRQESESEEHYNLFIQYLFAKGNRSIRFIADENNISERQIYRISNAHNWKARLNSYIQEENQMLKAEFALAQKETLREKLDVLTSTDSQILEVKNMLLYKGKEFLPKDLPAEKYIKRANTYLTLQLKIQKFDKSFSDHIENYDISENSELEDLKDMIEREMNTENKSANENSQKNLPNPDIEKARHSECNAVERRIQHNQSEAAQPIVLQNHSNIQTKNEKTNSNLPKPDINDARHSDRNELERRIQSAQSEAFASPHPLVESEDSIKESKRGGFNINQAKCFPSNQQPPKHDIENEYYQNPPDYSAISCLPKSDDPELQSVFDRLQ